MLGYVKRVCGLMRLPFRSLPQIERADGKYFHVRKFSHVGGSSGMSHGMWKPHVAPLKATCMDRAGPGSCL